MKYIAADLLREELQKLKNELKVENYYLDNSEQAVGYENALNDFESLINSLQQKPLVHTELCTLIACDIIQATAKRAIEKPQDKDKEEDLMIKKMEYLNMLEKIFFQQQQEMDLDKEIDACWQNWLSPSNQKEVEGVLPKTEFAMYARHFYELGCRRTAEMYDDIEYNRQMAEENQPVEGLEEAAIAYSEQVSDGHNYRDLRVGFIAGAEWGAKHLK